MGKDKLLEAAREGDIKVVEKILGQITKRSGPFITSLRRGASVNVQDENGFTPLHHACLRGHEDVVRLLLSVDASPCIVDKQGATPLHHAAWKGNNKIVNMLLSHSSQPVSVDQLTSGQQTALLIAAEAGYVDVVAQLLSRNADVTIQNKEEATALDLAAHFGRFEVVQQLLYAKPQLVDRYRFPTSRGQLFPHTPLHRAAKHGHEDVVALLIESGMDPNVKTANGTALHEAAFYNRDSVVRVLLRRGADLRVPDRRGRTVMDLLADFPSKATKKVRRTIAEYKATNGFESEEDLPAFPVPHRPPRSPSDFYDDERNVPETPNITNSITNNMSSSSSSCVNENHSQSFVKKLASKLGIKSKFNSAPNISNTSGLESEVMLKPKSSRERNNTNTILIGNSKFFKRISKKDDTGDIICNDEFDTISLDRLATLERTSCVNRSNRSCPGFKISLPNISENVEFNDSNESLEVDSDVNDINCIIKTIGSVEAVNEHTKVNIFEPREAIYSNVVSESAINEYYESYDVTNNNIASIDEPKPLPRKKAKPKTTNTIYENVEIEPKVVVPKPAVRTNINKPVTNTIYENFTLNSVEIPPEPHKRTICLANKTLKDSSPTRSGTSESSDSMDDETNLEDILLSQKSKSFKHKKATRTESNNSAISLSSDVTEASALDHVDCSDDKSMYASMTGTLPSKKPPDVPKKKVLFRHKTFSTIEVEKPKRNIPVSNNDFLKETLAGYHIRGTGHCIYEAPSVREFIDVFNRETLYDDSVEPFSKAPKRESFFETALCFCKPSPPKLHKSAEDLLAIDNIDKNEYAKIDTLKLLNNVELSNTSFKCFCDDETCKLHAKKRESPNSLMVKFSVINKSISTPDITLATTPITESVTIPPIVQEEPYAVVEIKDIVNNYDKMNKKEIPLADSAPSTLSHSSVGPYSIKDIAEVLSVKDNTLSSNDTDLNTTAFSGSSQSCSQRQSSSSEQSGHLSLKSCISNTSTLSEISFQSCIEETDSDDGTLRSDQSDTDTIKSDASVTKRPWVHSNSFNYGKRDAPVLSEEGSDDSLGCVHELDGPELGVASLECGLRARVRSGSGRRRWDEAEGTSEGDALSVSSAASSSAPQHLHHHHEFSSKVSPTPPKKPPRRNLSVSPTHANSPSSGYSYDMRSHARSQDDLDDIQGAKHYLKHGRSVDHYVDSSLSYVEYEEYPPRVAPIPNPRPSLKNRTQPVAITAMYENVVIKEQNPKRKLRRNNQYENYEPQKINEVHIRKYSTQKSSLESLLDNQSMNSPSECDPCDSGIQIPLSPTHYEQPPTPDHPPPSAKQAENSIHARIRPLSQEYKRRSLVRDSFTEIEANLLRAVSVASVASGATDRSGTDCVEEYVCEVPFAGLFKGSTTTLDGIGLRPMPAERPKSLRKLKSVYDASPTDSHPKSFNNGSQEKNGVEEEIRKRCNTTSSTQSGGDKSLSILSPFDEQEEWAKISEIMASFGSKLVRESVFVSELEQEFTSRLGLSCSESSLSPSVASNLGLWLSALGLQDYEQLFIDSGYDDLDFINGIIEENDLREMGVEESERTKILEAAKQLPLKITEISNNYNNNHKSKLKTQKENESVEEWLKSISLEIYLETFRKHLYVDMDRVRRIWEVELTAVLEIQKPGHRKRILASVSGQHNGPVNIEENNTDLNTLKTNMQQLKLEIKEKLPENLKAVPPPVVPNLMPTGPGGETLKRSKKNRPAPQPPRPSDLEIRAPSELLVGVPGVLKTQWKHQPFVLVTGAVTYVANYLGSTVVKELRGTESTKKSIQKLKKSTKEPRDSPDIILSINYRGVKFLNTITRELVCEHEIRNIHCACQDADDLTHFAYITKDHITKSHYCHVFCVATMDQATEVILTLGQAFEVAYQMALREQSNRSRVPQPHAKTPTHDPMTSAKEKPNLNHGRSHSITEIKLNGHQLKIAPIPASLSNEDFQLAVRDGSKSPRTPLLKAPMASTEEL